MSAGEYKASQQSPDHQRRQREAYIAATGGCWASGVRYVVAPATYDTEVSLYKYKTGHYTTYYDTRQPTILYN